MLSKARKMFFGEVGDPSIFSFSAFTPSGVASRSGGILGMIMLTR